MGFEEKDKAYKIGYAEGFKQGKKDMIKKISNAMYHQCFECDNDEDMQKWDSGNWFRYKLFENVMEQLKEQKFTSDIDIEK